MDGTRTSVNENTPLKESDVQTVFGSNVRCRPRRRVKKYPGYRIDQPLPIVLQVTLGLLGLWTPLNRKATGGTTSRSTKTSSYRHIQDNFVIVDLNDDGLKNHSGFSGIWSDESKMDDVDENGNQCSDIESDDEESEYLTDPQKRCSIPSDVIAIVYLVLSCSLMTYDFQNYMRWYWGKNSDILHLVSYFTFLFQVMAIPYWCFYARILYITLGRRFHTKYPLFRHFLSKRVAVLSNSRQGAKGLSWFRLLCFLAWPIMNAVLRFANDYYFKTCPGLDTYKEITHWSAFVGYIYYGCFCYLVHIERISFECEVHQISIFARAQARSKNVDAVCLRVSKFYAHYYILRRLMRWWMAFTMVVATWGLTAHLTWNYLIFSNADSINPENLPMLHSLNILVSTQKIMFFFVPFVAIGGMNLEHVWKRFKLDITRKQKYADDEYWRAVNRYLYQINVDHSGDLTPTLIYSAMGVYLGLKLGAGDQEYLRWNYPRGNLSDCYSLAYNFTGGSIIGQ